MLCRSAVILFSVFLCAPAVIVRRQADDSGEDQDTNAAPTWDAFIRDKADQCAELASDLPANLFCRTFNRCCQMLFDPLNGDRCQTIDNQCDSSDSYSCVLRNCTEMVTTTTTTAAPTTEEYVSTGERVVAWFSSIAIVLLALH